MGKSISRRTILKGAGACVICTGLGASFFGCKKVDATSQTASPTPVVIGKNVSNHQAKYWTAGEGKTVTCNLCPQGCITSPGELGFCKARRNIDGKYISLVYAQPVALHNDPIEKKPLYHVLPGTKTFSVGHTGCNLRCKHCQNWQLSQAAPGSLKSRNTPPDELVKMAKEAGSLSLAFTYNEPTTFIEYIIDCAQNAAANKMGACVVSNGFINEEPQKDLVKNLTAYKVDLKGFTEKFYSEVCGGELKPVLDSLVRLKSWGVWLEIVNLIIPTLNDDEKELNKMNKWVVTNLGKDTPIHFTRFHPMYKIRNLPPTPISTLEKAREIARAHGVRYAYTGNVPGHEFGNTYCHNCGKMLIHRYGFSVTNKNLSKGKCRACGTSIPGVWELSV